MNEDNIMLSVVCPTYNHEKYLDDAIKGILIQKTSFKYEVIIGEDCSTDGSKEVLKKWEEKCPSFFQFIYRDKNMRSIGKSNFNDLYSRARGKYLILLETDDFWLDPEKLEKQVRFLETHQDYYAVSHSCMMVDENGEPWGLSYPEIKKGEYRLKHFKRGILPGQTASIMYRNIYKKKPPFDCSLVTSSRYFGPGDFRRAFVFASNSKIFHLPEIMSAYRYVEKGGSSFSATNKFDIEKAIRYRKQFCDYAKENVSTKAAITAADTIFANYIIEQFLTRRISVRFLLAQLRDVVHVARLNACLFGISIIIKKPLGLNKTYKRINTGEEQKLLQQFRELTIML